MKMMMFVLDNPNQLDAILDAWRAIGVRGATIVESTGLYRRQLKILGARFLPSLPELVERVQQSHYTLFVVVPDAQTVRACLTASEEVVGNLAEPNSGILVSWELDFVKGLPLPAVDRAGDI